MEIKIINAVGLLLFAPTGNIFVLEELQDKPIVEKKAGMLSFPFETMEENESSSGTLQRLMSEEIGGQEFLSSKFNFVKKFYFFYHNQTIVAPCWVYSALCFQEFVANPSDSDIAHHGWVDPKDLIGMHIRKEAREVLEHLSSNSLSLSPQTI